MLKLNSLALAALLTVFASSATTAPASLPTHGDAIDPHELLESQANEALSSCPICGGSIDDLKRIVAWMIDIQIQALIRHGGV